MRQILSVVALSTLVAACGGGSVASNPTVNTNPNAPQPGEKLGQFTANRTINLSAATLRGTVKSDADENITYNNISSSQEGFGTNTQLNYDAATGRYGLKINQGGINRTLAPVALALSQNRDAYEFSNGSETSPEGLSVYAWQQGALNLSYVTYGAWARGERNNNSGQVELAYAAGGVATAPGDMPKTGKITYASAFEGAILTSSDYGGIVGNGKIEADFATGKVEGSFTGSQGLGTGNGAFNFTSSASIASGANSYAGSANGSAGSFAAGMTGSLSGGFFGPGAVETGGTFRLQGNGATAVGAFVGSQQQPR